MKIFISHQRSDSEIATLIAARLRIRHQIDVYVDTVDTQLTKTGDDLGDYIRGVLSSCTSLLAVVSTSTQTSWWVPWEIGVATEKDQPIATFTTSVGKLPEYLEKWPYLRSEIDLDEYANCLLYTSRCV